MENIIWGGEMKLRGARGLGDACYMYPIAKYFSKKYDKVEIMTRYPEVFEVLVKEHENIICIDRFAGQLDINCRYGERYPIQTTNMYDDALITAGIIEHKLDIPYEIKYNWPRFKFETNKKVCLIKTPAYPHSKTDGSSKAVLPRMEVWQTIIDNFKDKCFFVMSGLQNTLEFDLKGIDLDLSKIDRIPELIALVDSVDITITPSSHLASFAEGLDKKVLIGFAQTGIDSQISFYRWSTPAKVITKPNTTDAFIDSEPIEKILNKFERLLNK